MFCSVALAPLQASGKQPKPSSLAANEDDKNLSWMILLATPPFCLISLVILIFWPAISKFLEFSNTKCSLLNPSKADSQIEMKDLSIHAG